MRAVPPTPWTPGGSGANDEGQHRRHPPLPDVRGRRVRARARARHSKTLPEASFTTVWCGRKRAGPVRPPSCSPSPAAGSAAHTDPTPLLTGGTRRRRPLSPEIAAATVAAAGGATAAAAPVRCVGDGVSGNRVQAVYAYPADGADGYDEIAPFIRLWAGVVDTAFNDSAAETRPGTSADRPGLRARRRAALSRAGIASLSGTAAELAARRVSTARIASTSSGWTHICSAAWPR